MLRRNFVAGLVVTVPLAISVAALVWIFGIIDGFTAGLVGDGVGALQRLALPFRLFAGGPLGSGRQWFPWVHLDDAVGLYRFAVDNAALTGPLNLVSPDLRREKDVASAVGNVLGRPSWAPAPEIVLRVLLGQLAELILHGRRAEPRKALRLGFVHSSSTPEQRPFKRQKKKSWRPLAGRRWRRRGVRTRTERRTPAKKAT